MPRIPKIILVAMLSGPVLADNRDIQVRTVDFEAQTVELHNFGDATEDLDGWRLCTHNASSSFNYTGPSGLIGRAMGPGDSLFIHFANDAAPDADNQINAVALGGFVASFNRGPYSLGIYFPGGTGFVNFADGNLIADHIQWNIAGNSTGQSTVRSDEAVAGGVWTSIDAFIETTAESLRIELIDDTGGVLHGPTDYNVIEPGCPNDPNGEACDTDIAPEGGDCIVNNQDLGTLLAGYLSQSGDSSYNAAADFDGDGSINNVDLGQLLADYLNDCN